MDAEQAYLFRHAVLRDAAYQLQLPTSRSRLHALALYIISELLEGNEASLDAASLELADHARRADDPGHLQKELVFLRRAAAHLDSSFRVLEAVNCYLRITSHEEAGQEERWQAKLEAAERLEQVGDRQTAAALRAELRQAAHLRFQIAQICRVEALACRFDGRMDRALQEFALAHEALRELPEQVLHARLRSDYGITLHAAGRVSDAQEMMQSAHDLAIRLGERRIIGNTLSNLAMIRQETGDPAQLEAQYKRALAIHRENGNKRSEAITLANLGVLAFRTANPGEGAGCYREALEIHRLTGNRRGEGDVLNLIANLHLRNEEHEAAHDCYERGLAIAREVADLVGEAALESNLALLYEKQGLLAAAREHYIRADEVGARGGERRSQGITQANFASFLVQTGELGLASRYFESALSHLRLTRAGIYLGTALCNFANLRLLLGDIAEASTLGSEGFAEMARHASPELRVLHAYPVCVNLALAKGESAATLLAEMQSFRLQSNRAKMVIEQVLESTKAAPEELYFGILPSTLTSRCRAALLDRLKSLRPGELEVLRTTRPKVFAALSHGLEGLSMPCWQ